MTETQIIILSAIGVYFFAMIWIGVMASRNQTHEGFVIGARKVGFIPTTGSLAASFRDGMGVLFWFGFGAATGYGGLWLIIGAITGLFFFYFVGPKVRKLAKENNYITIGEMIRSRIGVITERFSAVIIIIFALMYTAIQLYVSGNIFAMVLGLDAWVGVASVAVVVGFYLHHGGYSTVIKTDVVQFFLILSLIALPIFFAPPMERVVDFGSLFSLDFNTAAGIGLIGLLFPISSADTWQRVFSAKNDKVVRTAFPASGVFLGIMTLSLIYLGMASAPFLGEAISEKNSFFQIFSGDFLSPPLLAFIAVVVIAICMSTLDTMCYLIASTLAKNFVEHRVTEERGNYITFSRIVMILILISMSIMALTISDAIQFLFNASSLLFILAPVYIAVALGYPRAKSREVDTLVTLSIAVSSIAYLYLYTNGYFDKNLLTTMIPVAMNSVLMGLSLTVGKRLLK